MEHNILRHYTSAFEHSAHKPNHACRAGLPTTLPLLLNTCYFIIISCAAGRAPKSFSRTMKTPLDSARPPKPTHPVPAHSPSSSC